MIVCVLNSKELHKYFSKGSFHLKCGNLKGSNDNKILMILCTFGALNEMK